MADIDSLTVVESVNLADREKLREDNTIMPVHEDVLLLDSVSVMEKECTSERVAVTSSLNDVVGECLLRDWDRDFDGDRVRVRLRVNDGVTHSTSCFHPASGLHRPLWFAHQWHARAFSHCSASASIAAHSAAHGAARRLPVAAQYPSAPHHVHSICGDA